jgi:mono/diheme cytochrome c family protein
MPRALRLPLVAVAAAVLVSAIGAAAPEGNVERGRYLVENVAMCGECHTPRRADGALDRDHWLDGAPVPVAAPAFVREWAIQAPRIAGLGTYSDDEATRLFTQAIGRQGRPLKPPMPRFAFSNDDAAAVIAYLRSLR